MRIAILANGASIHTIRWVNALAERGVDTHLFSAQEIDSQVTPDVRRYHLPLKGVPGYFLNVPFLRRQLRNIKPHLVHAHYASGYGTLGRLCGRHPWIVSVWGADVYEFPSRSRFTENLLIKNLSDADQVCSTSQAMAHHTATLCETRRPIAITPFGIDLQRFRPVMRHSDDSTIVVGTVKTLRPKYGIDTLIAGFARCRDQFGHSAPELAARLRLRIVGTGPQENELRELARSLGVAAVTDFVGAVPHERVPEELNKLDIYAAISRFDSESFGVAVIEASACGKPVVVSDTPGLKEVVEHGATGYVISREDPDALARVLGDLANDAKQRRILGDAGRERVRRLYDWDENVAQMLRIYEATVCRARAA